MNTFLFSLKDRRTMIPLATVCFAVTLVSGLLYRPVLSWWPNASFSFFAYYFMLDPLVFYPVLAVWMTKNNRHVFGEYMMLRYGSRTRAYIERLKLVPLECLTIVTLRAAFYIVGSIVLNGTPPSLIPFVINTIVSQFLGFLFTGALVFFLYALLSSMKISLLLVFMLTLVDSIGLLGRPSIFLDVSGMYQVNAAMQLVAGKITEGQMHIGWVMTALKTALAGFLCVFVLRCKYKSDQKQTRTAKFKTKIDPRKLYLAFAGAGLALILCLFARVLMPFPPGNSSIATLLLVVMGGYMPLDSGVYGVFYYAVLMLLPVLLQFSFYGNYFKEDWQRAGVYIFSRMGKRTAWYWRKTRELLVCTLAFYGAEMITVCITGVIFGLPFGDSQTLFAVFALVLALGFGVQFLYLFALNMLSMRIGSVFAALICYITHVPLTIMALFSTMGTSAQWLVWLVPSVHGMIPFHDLSMLKTAFPVLFQDALPGFGWLYSIAYILIVFSALYMTGRYRIKKMSILP